MRFFQRSTLAVGVAAAMLLSGCSTPFSATNKGSGTPNSSDTGIVVSGWTTSIGAVSSNDTSFAKQKFSFTAFILNNTKKTVYVKSLKVNLSQPLQRHILSGSSVISVNESLAPDGKVNVPGHFIIDTKGMTKPQIAKLAKIDGFTVKTGSTK